MIESLDDKLLPIICESDIQDKNTGPSDRSNFEIGDISVNGADDSPKHDLNSPESIQDVNPSLFTQDLNCWSPQ